MPQYAYQAKRGPQETVTGTIDAATEKDAIERLSVLGLVPVSIAEERAARSEAAPVSAATAAVRLGSRHITLFSRQLASLLKSGVPILKALVIIREQSENRSLKAIVQRIYKEVEAGAPFSSVLAQYPRAFPALYVALVRAGEDSGKLPDALFKIARYRQKQEEVTARFRMAMVYPCLMALVGVGSVVFMLTFVMPKLTKLYKDMGQSLPVPTRILIAATNTLQHSGFWVLIIAAAVILIFKRYAVTKAGRVGVSVLQLGLPVVGPLVTKAELARFCRTLEMLLKSGIPILRALNVTVPVLGNEVIKTQLAGCSRDLEQGGTLGRSLKNASTVPSFMSNLLIVGEETGKLDDSLAEVADAYERDTDEAMAMMASLLEPAMILIMGAAVGFIVVAMLLPIFDINVMVR
ncbi:MAG: type II secretion system F family protein [Candidatus Omnitrophica bacterium]|nr:type II secretion system F family protein [Candidatus Omnitrophota bacterium]